MRNKNNFHVIFVKLLFRTARRPILLDRPDVAESVDEFHRKEPPGWRKGILAEVSSELERRLEVDGVATLTEAQRWSREEHELELHYNRI